MQPIISIVGRSESGKTTLLEGLIAELKRQRVVRPGERGDGWVIATAEIERLPTAPAWQWLASRSLADIRQWHRWIPASTWWRGQRRLPIQWMFMPGSSRNREAPGTSQ